MKLSKWAQKVGLTYDTAYNLFRSGKLPVKAIQLETGTILVEEDKPETKEERVVVYCRVSNHSRKKEIEYQVERCEEYCRAKGYSISKVYKEIASGMNDNRKQLWKMIESEPTKIIVENKDRLTRFGFNYLDKLLSHKGCSIEVINQDHEDETDLIKDMIAVVTSFCCRLYGARRGQNKARKIKETINDKND
jgi:predicted site-specific integrase-resolvase